MKTTLLLAFFSTTISIARADPPADAPALTQLQAKLGTPGRMIIDTEDPGVFVPLLTPDASSEKVSDNSKDAPPGGPALRVHVAKAGEAVYSVQVLSGKSKTDVHQGDVLLCSCWVRAAQATGIAALRLQLDREPWTSPAETSKNCTNAWQEIFASGVADADYPAGSLEVTIFLGQQPQVMDIADIVVVDVGPGINPSTLPHTAITWPGMEPDAPWRAEAQRRIERYRMADLSITVTDAAGQPVPNAQVHLQQQTRDFTIGSFVQYADPTPLVTDSPDGDKDRAIFLHLFNRATSPLYWADWGWPGKKQDFLAIAGWLHDHHYTVRGHVMIYPAFNFMPREIQKLKNDPVKLQARILQQIDEIAEATKPFGFREYDVTNELRDCTDLWKILGKDAVAQWYAEARRIVPNAKMALNENTILTEGGATLANQNTYLGWYNFLKSKGQAPDVLGLQSHFSENFTDPVKIWAILDRFSRETDAELQVTEFDINTTNEEAQGAYTRDFMTAVFAHPRITGFTMWGFWEGNQWRPNGAFWRKDWSIKPNGKVLEELLTKTWWTDKTVTTDAQGHATIKAFLGTHQVSVTAGDKSVVQDVALHRAGDTGNVTISLK